MADFDVLIAGGGAGGCSAAITLGARAPDLRVCIVDDGLHERISVGETLPPPAAAILKHLDVYERFEADRHPKAFRTLSAWGSREPAANEFLFGVHQFGWLLDRARFDAMLAAQAKEHGARWKNAKVVRLDRAGDPWTVHCDDGSQITARFLLDATGRPAALSRLAGRVRASQHDRLIACLVRFEGCASATIEPTVEAFADGWWFTTTRADGARIVACMSDSDIVRRRNLGEMDSWRTLLEQSDFVRAATAGATPAGPPRLLAASSCIRSSSGGEPFLALGDAASCFDPLSSQGIVKALRSGVFAAYSACDFLVRGDARGLSRYRLFVQEEFAAYLRTLRDYYSRERRWRDEPFWQRRHGDRAQMKSAAMAATSDVAPVTASP